MERETVRKIREAVHSGKLPQPFRSAQVEKASGIPLATARTFLSKHCVGNPKHETEHFERISRGLYRLKSN